MTSEKRIDGLQFEKMLKNGLARLRQLEREINRLNVFPVSDGDTGTNMRLTLESGIRYAGSDNHLGAYMERFSKGMLLGARGNSGVILSQFFKGFSLVLRDCQSIGTVEYSQGLVKGYQVAYKAVVNPTEGTILTVTREGIETIRDSVTPELSLEDFLSRYLSTMNNLLDKTPELLPVLKEAGVVDSGALGFITITEGILSYLRGEIIRDTAPEESTASTGAGFDLFDENSSFQDGYCMEYILQLLKAPCYRQDFVLEEYIEALKECGNSLVVVQDEKRIKVHIHTLSPAKVILLSQRYGEFLTFKLENMQVQHNEHEKLLSSQKPRKIHKLLATVAVANGEGMKRIFSDLGCDVVIDGGSTMNTSSQEFLDAFAGLDADAIVVLPNHPNVILAAQQAIKLYDKKIVTVLPSKSIAEGYFAMAMDVSNSTDIDFRISEMTGGMENTVTLCETTAFRDYTEGSVSCRKGDEILLLDHHLVCVSNQWLTPIMQGLQEVEDMEDKETCVVFRGEGVPEEHEEILLRALGEAYPTLDVEFVNGGQSVYHWILGLV